MTAIVSRRLLIFIIPVIVTLVFGAWGGIIGPLLPTMAREFGGSVPVYGALILLNFGGAFLAVLLSGVLADHFGKKRVFLVALTGFGAACALIAGARSITDVAAGSLLGGAMGGALEGLCGALIADQDPDHRDRNMNLLQIGYSVGAVLGLLLTGWLPGADTAWRGIYLLFALTIGGCCVAGFFMRVRPAPPGEPISWPVIRQVAGSGPLLLLLVAIALYVGSEMSLAQWISPLLEKKLGYSFSVAVLAPALFWLATGVGRGITGLACRHLSALRLLGWLLVGGLASYVVLLLPVGPWRYWVGSGLAGLTFSGVWPLIVSLGSARHPAHSGTVVAMLVAAGSVGGLVFPWLIGLLLWLPHPYAVRWALLAMLGLFAALAVAIDRYARRLREVAVPA